MKRLLSFGIFVMALSGFSQGTLQNFKYFNETYHAHKFLSVGAVFSSVKDDGVPNPQGHSVSGWSVNFEYQRLNFEKGGFRYTARAKMYMDVIFLLDRALTKGKRGEINRKKQTGITSGILGWHSLHWNAIAKDQFCLSLGFNASDHFYGTTFLSDSSGKLFTPEPNGYYLGLGPTVGVDYRINDWFKVNVLVDYTVSLVKATGITYGQEIEGFPLPHFINTSVELTSKWGAYLKYDYSAIINRSNSPTNGKRSDFSVGFKFYLK